MACDCESYVCLGAFVNPCSEGVELPVVATYTGAMSGRVWFNGTIKSFGIAVTQGENIIAPAEIFNENYVHQMRLYDAGGDLINCYKVKTLIDTDAPDFTPIPANIPQTYRVIFKMGSVSDINAVYGTPINILNGNTIQYNDLIGSELIDVEELSENLLPITGMGIDNFNATTGTINLSSSKSDTFFKVVYKK